MADPTPLHTIATDIARSAISKSRWRCSVLAVSAIAALGGYDGAQADGPAIEQGGKIYSDAGMSREIARQVHDARCSLWAMLSELPAGTNATDWLEQHSRLLYSDPSKLHEDAERLVDLADREPGCAAPGSESGEL